MTNKKMKDFEPEVVVLYCQYCIGNTPEMKREYNRGLGFKARFVMLPCSSKIEVSHILKILAEGADGVQVIGCMEKKCRFLVGSVMEEKRIEYVRGLLDEIKMGGDRVGMSRGEGLSEGEMLDIAKQRADAVKILGPTPMKPASVL